MSSVDTLLLYILGEPVDAVAVWKQLAEQFQKRTWANKLPVRICLYPLQLKSGDSIQEHIKLITETFSPLSVVGDKTTDENRVVLLLSRLPATYSVLVSALKTCVEVPSMEMVIECLLHKE